MGFSNQVRLQRNKNEPSFIIYMSRLCALSSRVVLPCQLTTALNNILKEIGSILLKSGAPSISSLYNTNPLQKIVNQAHKWELYLGQIKMWSTVQPQVRCSDFIFVKRRNLSNSLSPSSSFRWSNNTFLFQSPNFFPTCPSRASRHSATNARDQFWPARRKKE